MEEVLTRRFRNYLRERDEGARAGKRFAYPPNLLLIDGGKGQLNVAVRVLEDLGLEEIAVAGLAKRFEEVYLPGPAGPGADPPRLRGALPPAERARRGAPLRDHVPPPAAGEEADPLGPRRRPRARLDPSHAPAQAVRFGEANARAAPKTRSWRSRGCPTPSGGRCSRSCTANRCPRRLCDHEEGHDAAVASRSRSRSSPACRARAGRRPRTCSRTSGSS